MIATIALGGILQLSAYNAVKLKSPKFLRLYATMGLWNEAFLLYWIAQCTGRGGDWFIYSMAGLSVYNALQFLDYALDPRGSIERHKQQKEKRQRTMPNRSGKSPSAKNSAEL